MKRGVYDLMCATPHVPDGARYTAEEFRTYREGYTWALVIVYRVLMLSEEQHAIMARQRRRMAKEQRPAAQPVKRRA